MASILAISRVPQTILEDFKQVSVNIELGILAKQLLFVVAVFVVFPDNNSEKSWCQLVSEISPTGQ